MKTKETRQGRLVDFFAVAYYMHLCKFSMQIFQPTSRIIVAEPNSVISGNISLQQLIATAAHWELLLTHFFLVNTPLLQYKEVLVSHFITVEAVESVFNVTTM